MNILALGYEKSELYMLHNYLKDIQDINNIHIYTYSAITLSFIQQNIIDIVLLDIKLCGVCESEFVSEINSLPYRPEIIFISENNEFVSAFYKCHGLNYLLKPISSGGLKFAIERAVNIIRNRIYLQNNTDRLIMKQDDPPLFFYKKREIYLRTIKSAKLLGILVNNAPYSVTQTYIMDSLWDDFEADAALNNLRVTICYLKKLLSEYNVSIIYATGKYRLEGEVLIQ